MLSSSWESPLLGKLLLVTKVKTSLVGVGVQVKSWLVGVGVPENKSWLVGVGVHIEFAATCIVGNAQFWVARIWLGRTAWWRGNWCWLILNLVLQKLQWFWYVILSGSWRMPHTPWSQPWQKGHLWGLLEKSTDGNLQRAPVAHWKLMLLLPLAFVELWLCEAEDIIIIVKAWMSILFLI
jgi:hypothetical protein